MARTPLPSLPPGSPWPPAGAWIVASRALGRVVDDGQRYPHLDGSIVRLASGRDVKLWRRDCVRCSEDAAARGEAS